MRSLHVCLFVCLAASAVLADDIVRPGAPVLDRPTLTAIGIRVPVTGDDNYNASVSVRYRKSGASAWSDGMPLFRAHPESVVSTFPTTPHFAGSILDLRPGASYEVELHVVDPDGVDQTLKLTASTRSMPASPATPRNIEVNSVATLNAALANARAGDIITLADGVYRGQFVLSGGGTVTNPIVIRGASITGTILDGAGCAPCNVLEVYGSYVYIERLSIRNAERAIRFQTAGATGNVVRRVSISNTRMGIGGKAGQQDFYIADNILAGRLTWPTTYATDGGAHSDDDGIAVVGSGHVVAHNRISGYGDAIKNLERGSRSVDYYGNEVLYTYDNGLELDGAAGNVRALRNRFTNTYMPFSVQPVLVGPAYIIRNVSVNSEFEQVKSHIRAVSPVEEPNGVLVYNNTFVSPYMPLTMQGSGTSHHMTFHNNLFVGPAVTLYGYAVDWYGRTNNVAFDWNGYFPDGQFAVGRQWAGNFAQYQKNVKSELHGKLLSGQVFLNGLAAPLSHYLAMAPQDALLSAQSPAIDAGVAIPNVSSSFNGAAPDLGAIEHGCSAPLYGPRPEGTDETAQQFECITTSSATPASLSVVSGSAQSAQAGSAFASPLVVVVRNASGAPLSGVPVTFAAPAQGASAIFGGGSSSTVATNASGQAVSPVPKAGALAGTYQVEATAGTLRAGFTLTNAAAVSPVTMLVGAAPSVVYPSSAAQPLTLSATVNSASGSTVVNTGVVEFGINGTAIGRATVSAGKAQTTWNLPAGTNAGVTFTITASYSGSSTHAAGSASGALTVSRLTPKVTWRQPADLTFGAALSSTQLNPTADVPGTFTFSPAAGAVLLPGLGQALTAKFQPADTVNYAPVSVQVAINVNPPALMIQAPATVDVPFNATRDASTRAVLVSATATNPASAPQSVNIVLFSVLGGASAANLPADFGAVPAKSSKTLTLQLPASTPPGFTWVMMQFHANGVPTFRFVQIWVP